MTNKTIDHYIFDTRDILGSGSFGVVFRAYDTKNNMNVALKMIAKDKLLNDPSASNGVIAEIKIMRKLHNKNIVQLLDVLETKNNYYIIQEICDSGDLAKYLKKNKIVDEKLALKIMTDILEGFIELIKYGVIHRDLKPANILINQNVFKIADFGFAKIVDNFAQQLFYSQVGTPLYMSPQILKNDKYTTKCDVWSFGFLFYEMLYGKTPWLASSIPQLVKNINTQPLIFDDQINKVSDQVKDLIKKCLIVNESINLVNFKVERYSWYDIFAHPLFQIKFLQTPNLQQICEKKELYIANSLREIIAVKQLSLIDVFNELELSENGVICIESLGELLTAIDDELEDYEITYIFQNIDKDQDGEITCQEFYNWMLQHDIINESCVRRTQNTIYTQPQQQGQQIGNRKLIYNLIQAIQKENLNLVELYYKFVSDSEIMTYEDFTELMLSYNHNLNEEEIQQTFSYFDLDQTNLITLEQFKFVLEQDIEEYQ